MPFATPPLPLLERLPRSARDRLVEAGREVCFDPGQRLIYLMEASGRLLILEQGLAKLNGVTVDGKKHILYFFRPGEIVGLHMLMKENTASTFEVVAMGRVRSLAISNRDFLAIAREDSEVFRMMTRLLQGQLDRLAASMLQMTSSDAIQRLARLLLDLIPDGGARGESLTLNPVITHETMAQIIGVSRPHTSTLLGELEELGAIERLKPRGLCVRPAALQRIVSQGPAQAA